MNYDGLITGLASFIIIGFFHPLVIKGEFHFGVKIWPLFLLCGVILCGLSVFFENSILRAVSGIAGFSSLWSILEIFHQRERVRKGWFPSKNRTSNSDKNH